MDERLHCDTATARATSGRAAWKGCIDMAVSIKDWKRTRYCGELRAADVGQTVTLDGWVQRTRNLGGLIFVWLRDRSGLVQVVFDESVCGREAFELGESLRSEYTERLSKAKEEAAEIVGSATRRATVRSEEILRESSQQAAAMMKKAENTIEQERRKAMNELKDEVASLSVMIASRVVERDVKEADHERFIEEFIDKVG
mgnify:CR=1 FL=1